VARDTDSNSEPLCSLARPRVLIAETDSLVRKFLVFMLAWYGYIPMAVETAAETFDALDNAKQPFDAIVIHANLKDVSGTDILRQVRSERSAIPAILISAGPADEACAYAATTPSVKFLGKPLAIQLLIQTLTDLIGHRPLPDAKRWREPTSEGADASSAATNR